jgi:hypothetical protein
VRGTSLNGGGKGAFIYNDKILPGDTIKCYIKLKKDVTVLFSIISINDNQLNIDIGKAYFDYSNNQTAKLYSLNATSYNLS